MTSVAERRDTLLSELLEDTNTELSNVQLFLVRDAELRGWLALDSDGSFDDGAVRQRRLPLAVLSVASRTVKLGIPYFGPLPTSDPASALVPAGVLAATGLALLPLRFGAKTVGLLIGHPRRAVSRDLRDVLCALVHDASRGLARLIESARAAGDNTGGVDEADFDAPLPTRPAPIDVGRASPGETRRRETLTGHPAVRLASADDFPAIGDEAAPTDDGDTAAGSAQVFLLTQRKNTTAEKPRARERRTSETEEQRSHARRGLRVEVHHEHGGSFFTGFMEDISEGGLLLATYCSLSTGQRLTLTFTIPGMSTECQALAEVRWLRPGTSERALPGAGLQFIELSTPTRAAIRRFVDARRGPVRSTPS